MIVDMGIPILIEYHVNSVLPFFPDIVPLLVNLGDKSFFLFSTECRTIINMGMPHLNPWSGRGWHVSSYVVGTLGTCHKGLSCQLCSMICIYIKFAIHLLCFLPLFSI